MHLLQLATHMSPSGDAFSNLPTGSQQLPSCPAPSLHFLPTVPVVHSPQLLSTSPHFACRMPPRQECQFCEDMWLSGASTRQASKEQALSKCLWCLKRKVTLLSMVIDSGKATFPGAESKAEGTELAQLTILVAKPEAGLRNGDPPRNSRDGWENTPLVTSCS